MFMLETGFSHITLYGYRDRPSLVGAKKLIQYKFD
jgi:hypothetical protein